MYNRVFLVGRLGKEAEVWYTRSGKAVANLVVGTERRYYSKKENRWKAEVEWHKVRIRGKRAENLVDRVKKGDLIMVEGELRYDVFEGKKKEKVKIAYVEAGEVKILGKKREENGNGAENKGGNDRENEWEGEIREAKEMAEEMEDVPF